MKPLIERFFLWEKGGEFFPQDEPPFSTNNKDQQLILKGGAMVIFIPVKLKKLFKQGRNYPWKKPDTCSACKGYRLWGHGYAGALFDNFNKPLLLKLYRCPDCGCVIRLRPTGYFKRFQASIDTIRSSISSKSENGKWLPSLNKTRQRHWHSALLRWIKARLGDTWEKGILQGFDHLVSQGYIPVSRFI